MSACKWRDGCHNTAHSKGRREYTLCLMHLDYLKKRKAERMRQWLEESKARQQEFDHIAGEAEALAKDRQRIRLDRVQSCVVVRPANTSFAAQAKRRDGWESIRGGIRKVVGSGRDGMAYAQAYAQALKKQGIGAQAYALLEVE